MPSRDHYRSFTDIALQEAGNYQLVTVRRDSPYLIAAPHGGGIEPGTSEIARGLAGTDHSLYLFESLLGDDSHHLHITSGRFDEPKGLALAAAARTVITVHGCEGAEPMAHIGGRDRELADALVTALGQAGFTAQPDPGRNPGVLHSNLCNRGWSKKGVQLELETGLRKLFFRGLDRAGRKQATPELDRFVEAIRSVLTLNEEGRG